MSALRDPGRGQAQPPVGRSSSDELFAYFRLSVGLAMAIYTAFGGKIRDILRVRRLKVGMSDTTYNS